MLKNYFKTSFRSLLRNKVYSTITIAGLALGLSCFMLVSAYNRRELSFDKSFANARNIYRITTSLNVNGVSTHYPFGHFPAATDMVHEFPEVKSALRIFGPSLYGGGVSAIRNGELVFPEERFFLTDSTFFQFFDFPFKLGNAADALREPYSVVLTSETAKKYFGNEDPIGKTLLYNDSVSFRVSGVLQPITSHTHLKFDFVANAQQVIQRSILPGIDLEHAYIGLWYFAYIELAPGADKSALEDKLHDFVKRHYPPRYTTNNTILTLQPVTDIHLHSADMAAADMSANGSISYVYILSVVAISVLIVACFNFINLATARYMARVKEVGVRKAIGAGRGHLISQFIAESVLISALAGIVAAITTTFSIPPFNVLANSNLALNDVFSTNGIAESLVLFVIVGVLSGAYPAFILSNYQAAAILKGTVISGGNKFNVRKLLVVLQFSVSQILIIGTLVVLSQLDFLKNKSMGFDKEQILFLQDSGSPVFQQFPTFKNKLLSASFVKEVTYLSSDLGQQNLPFYPFKAEGKAEEQMLPILRAGFDFPETFHLQMLQGRFFDVRHPRDSTLALVINESAAKAFGWTTAVGKKLTFGVGGTTGQEVIGVIQDFNFNPLRNPVGPLVISFSVAFGNIAVKLKPGNNNESLRQIAQMWKEAYPALPFSFYFLDEGLNNTYKEEQRLASIYTVFCSLAIFIACLGLFALASYTIEKRKKEIAVRKVMGASQRKIALLVYMDFLVLILLGFVTGAPAAWYFFHKWLQQFAYRTDIRPGLFFVALLVVVVLSAATVAYQTWKAARLNPAIVLKNE